MTSQPHATVARAAQTGAARAAVAVLALVLTGCTTAHEGVATGPGPKVHTTAGASAKPTGDAVVRAVGDVPVRRAQDAPSPSHPAVVRVQVPALEIDVPVRPTGVDDAGRMDLPGSADVAGWYRFGSAPTSPAGATVVAAHVDDEDSVGPFARLARTEVGTVVNVRTADGTAHNYTVTDVWAEPKRDLSPDDLFDRAGAPRLVLVTCGGEWDPDARSYRLNVVVTAVPRG